MPPSNFTSSLCLNGSLVGRDKILRSDKEFGKIKIFKLFGSEVASLYSVFVILYPSGDGCEVQM